MSDTDPSNEKKPTWYARIVQFFLAGCVAIGGTCIKSKGTARGVAHLGHAVSEAPALGSRALDFAAMPKGASRGVAQLGHAVPEAPGLGSRALDFGVKGGGRLIKGYVASEQKRKEQERRAAQWNTQQLIHNPERHREPSSPSGSAAPRQPTPPLDAPLGVVTSPNVDERLFLLRALETMYRLWPIGVEDLGKVQAALAELRQEANRHHQYVKDRKLDDQIASLYGDLVGLLDLCGSMLDERGKAPAQDEAKRLALEANARDFQAKFSTAYARMQSAAIALTQRYGWAGGEAGFDVSPEQERKELELLEKGDVPGLLRVFDIDRAKRPRDPFVLVGGASLRAQSLGQAASPEALADLMDDCMTAAGLVPEGAFYDTYRSEFIGLAGLFANAAAGAELGKRGMVAAPVSRGAQAVRVWRTYLALEPQDTTGVAREQLALALAAAGRQAEAVATATEVAQLRGNDPDFAYNYACLLSVTGATKDALGWLEHAVKQCGYGGIAWAKADPDLARVRSEQASGFLELTAVRFEWSIDWGTFPHDDIVLVNKSPFPLTNVTLDATVTSTGAAPWSQPLSAERIEPGATHRWSTWITARGQEAKGTATLGCDQAR
jgi:hypothetical protein